jgi:acyl dehydratase
MREYWLEDLTIGDRFRSGTFLVSKNAMVDFAREFDPQPFHLDQGAAEKSVFAGLAASGWYTGAVTMWLFVTGELKLAGGTVGLGVDELRWPVPVRAGDVLRSEIEVLDKRASRSKPGRGIIRIRNVTTNQDDKAVQTYVASILVRKRSESVE